MMKHYQFDDALRVRALNKFGVKNQLRQLQEEMGEVDIEIHHFFRGRPEKIVEEIADFFIVFNQLEEHLGSEFIQRAIFEKQKKLKAYLDYKDRKNAQN